MPTTAQERARNASVKAAENARARRFRRYAVEMAAAGEALPDDVQKDLADLLSERGWFIDLALRD